MSLDLHLVPLPPRSASSDRIVHLRPLAAFADGPVADTPEPVTPQAGIVGAEPDGDDGDTVTHG